MGTNKVMLKKTANKLLSYIGYQIQKIKPIKKNILYNVFHSNYSRKILISYIQRPFILGVNKQHSNMLECYTAAEIFHKNGYQVDVAEYMSQDSIDYDQYEVVYGFGYPLERAFYSDCAEKIKKIYYSTGCCNFYQNKNTALKILKFQKEKHKIIPQSGRLVYHFWTLQFIMPDLNVCLGNQFVSNTYLEINPDLNIRTLLIFYWDVYDIDLSQKDFQEAKKHFLWFGSEGLLHKGLDILIDIFSKRDDIFLHICGASKSEKKFFEYYQPIIDKSNNIIEHGFLDISSDNFKEIMDLCAFCCFPSVSEGGAAASVNVMANGGLIPIASKSSGVDIEDFGFVFEDIDEKVIVEMINQALSLSDTELYEKSNFVKTSVRECYTYENYKKNLTDIILSELK